jgi:isoquinoline 1-oxidoreductase beta subunit
MLYGECTIQGGRVQQENFDTYPFSRIAEMSDVELKTVGLRSA